MVTVYDNIKGSTSFRGPSRVMRRCSSPPSGWHSPQACEADHGVVDSQPPCPARAPRHFGRSCLQSELRVWGRCLAYDLSVKQALPVLASCPPTRIDAARALSPQDRHSHNKRRALPSPAPWRRQLSPGSSSRISRHRVSRTTSRLTSTGCLCGTRPLPGPSSRVEARRCRLLPLMLLLLYLHLLLMLLLLLLYLRSLQLVPSRPAASCVGRSTSRRGTPHPHSGRSCSAC